MNNLGRQDLVAHLVPAFIELSKLESMLIDDDLAGHEPFPFMVPPGLIGSASLERPAGTANVFDTVGEVVKVTLEGAVVNTTAQMVSSN